ncbi:protein CERLI1 [Plasmodium yoelii yoelii]|nr:protein CERLI1 [Plasmodium yoelii yoelii]
MKKNKIKELTTNYVHGKSQEEIEINRKLSQSFSKNSIKNKYLEKKNLIETLSNADEENYKTNDNELDNILKDMTKNMYIYSD